MGEKSGRNERAAARIEGIIARCLRRRPGRYLSDAEGEGGCLFPGRGMHGDLLAAFADNFARSVRVASALRIERKPGFLGLRVFKASAAMPVAPSSGPSAPED
jgi:hypothetical protein